MKRYRLVIFDLDGTLLDTSEGILLSVQHTIKQFGFEQPRKEELLRFIGPPIQDSFSKQYGLEGPVLQEIATVFRDRYKDVDLFKATPYDGIYEALAELKRNDIKLAVATYKREDYALSLLCHFGFDKYFDVMHGADHYNRLKKSDIIIQCVKEMEISDTGAVALVGDTKSDEIGAIAAGVDFLGVTYGFGYKTTAEKDESKAIAFANSPMEIERIILKKDIK